MPRYVIRGSSMVRSNMECDGWNEGPLLTNIDVTESGPINTGLVDSDGNSIWRVKDPIGFLHHEEQAP